ncbi:MAG: hypothetical protein ACR2NN_25905 [Bryobacteraceae bacterium]
MPADIGSRWLFKEFMDFDGSIPQGTDYAVYMKALLICANGDGRLSGQGELIEELKTFRPEGDYKAIIQSKEKAIKSVRAFIYDAIQACSADGEYHAKERQMVKKAAVRLGVPEDVVDLLEALFEEAKSNRRKRLNLIWANGKSF